MSRTQIGAITQFNNTAYAPTMELPARSVAPGSLLIVAGRFEETPTSVAVTDTTGATWQVETHSNVNVQVFLAWSYGHPGGSDVVITATMGADKPYRSMAVIELSGGDVTDPVQMASLVESSAILNHTMPVATPCDIFAVQGSYSTGNISATPPAAALTPTSSVLFLFSAIRDAASSPQTIANTGGSGNTASLSLAFSYPGGDATKPVLSAPAVAAVSSTSATGGVTTTEAGPAWAVITNSATKPTATQTKLGQDHTGSPALAADSALLAAGANPSAFLFTGLDPASTGLYEHITQDDEADPPNTADVVTAGPFSTPAAPVRCTLTLTTDGSAIAANMTGLSWCWWDSAAPDLSLAPKASGTGATTNASGVFDVALPGSTLTTGQTGRLLVYSGNGVAGDVSNKAFCGPVVVS